MFRVTYKCSNHAIPVSLEIESDPRVSLPPAPPCSVCNFPMVMADVLNLEQRASLQKKSRSRPKVKFRPGRGFQAEQLEFFK